MNFNRLDNTKLASAELNLARELFLTMYSCWVKRFPLENPYNYYWHSHYDIRDTNTLGNTATYCIPLHRTPEQLKVILKCILSEESDDYINAYNDLVNVPKDILIVCFSAWKGHDNLPYASVISKSRADPTRMCWYCAKETNSTCSKCKVGKFCNRGCQSRPWVRPIHKRVCGKLNEFVSIVPLMVPMEKIIVMCV